MNIVVGYVRTSAGEAAMDAALAEARLRGASLVVVHSTKGGQREDAAETVAYQEAFEAVDRRLAGEGVDYRMRQLTRGNEPVEDIIEVAREEGAALIVIGLRRRSAVGKFVLGSNAQEILMEADCPVLAVKAHAPR